MDMKTNNTITAKALAYIRYSSILLLLIACNSGAYVHATETIPSEKAGVAQNIQEQNAASEVSSEISQLTSNVLAQRFILKQKEADIRMNNWVQLVADCPSMNMPAQEIIYNAEMSDEDELKALQKKVASQKKLSDKWAKDKSKISQKLENTGSKEFETRKKKMLIGIAKAWEMNLEAETKKTLVNGEELMETQKKYTKKTYPETTCSNAKTYQPKAKDRNSVNQTPNNPRLLMVLGRSILYAPVRPRKPRILVQIHHPLNGLSSRYGVGGKGQTLPSLYIGYESIEAYNKAMQARAYLLMSVLAVLYMMGAYMGGYVLYVAAKHD